MAYGLAASEHSGEVGQGEVAVSQYGTVEGVIGTHPGKSHEQDQLEVARVIRSTPERASWRRLRYFE